MNDREMHPSFGMIGAYRTSIGPTGAALFDSDIEHRHTVVVRIQHAERKRDLNRDWIHGTKQIIEVEMSEAQWASFVSSMNTSGVPCTLKWQEGMGDIEGVPFAPRLEHSMAETRKAADKAFANIVEALDEYEAKPSKAALRTLRARVENATPNVAFAGESLAEHAENVVQKARADIEAMVVQKATQLGIEAPALRPLLTEGSSDE